MDSLSNLDNLIDRELEEIPEIQKGEEKFKRRMQHGDSDIMPKNGQLKFGCPPPNWGDPSPSRGRVFVGKLPGGVSLQEVHRVSSPVGNIYAPRSMVELSGFNRGFGCVAISTKAEATLGVEMKKDYELRPCHCIGEVKSVDNCHHFVGDLPKDKSAVRIQSVMMRLTEGLNDNIVYSFIVDKLKNRDFVFGEYFNPRAASKPCHKLIPERFHMWGNENAVYWVAPVSHFVSMIVAEKTIKKSNNVRLNGTAIEITWPKPVREKNLSTAGSCRSSCKGSRPSFRKSAEISLPSISPRNHIKHSHPSRNDKIEERNLSTTSQPFRPVEQQQFLLPRLPIQSLNVLLLVESNFELLPPSPPILLWNREFGPLNFTFHSVLQQNHHLKGNAMFCSSMGKGVLRIINTAPVRPMFNQIATIENKVSKIGLLFTLIFKVGLWLLRETPLDTKKSQLDDPWDAADVFR